jgi:NAD+ kinase
VATVALLVHEGRDDAMSLAGRVSTWLTGSGHRARLLVLTDDGRVTEGDRVRPVEAVDLSGAELAVGLGGDDTFLRLVALAWAAGVPVLGVNFGHLGYLLELAPEDLETVLLRVLSGDVSLEERVGLSVEVGSRTWFALNEVVLEKTVFGHTVRLDMRIDGERFLTYSADGLLIATPTGSTAYNLSAGGPVLSPRLQAMVVTPVAPHLSLDRSLVLHPDQVVTVQIVDGRPAALVIDGQEVGRLVPGDGITCKVAGRPIQMVTTGDRGFGGLLRAALALDRLR